MDEQTTFNEETLQELNDNADSIITNIVEVENGN